MIRLLFLILLFFPAAIFSQNNEEIINNIILQIIEEAEEETDLAELYHDLTERINNPVNLNFATRDDLRSLRFLSEIEIESIIRYRKNFGFFMAEYELQAVRELSEQSLFLLLFFVEIDDVEGRQKLTSRDFFSNGKHEKFFRYRRILEPEAGYDATNRRYAGSPDYFYTRYNYRLGNRISYGFTAEKDAGEHFFNETQPYGFDFYSAHFYLADAGKIKKLALGDYQLQFGQGLVLWSGLSFSKSADVMNIAKNARGILPYRSVDENRFFRGGAATINSGNFDFTWFGSQKKMDASLQISDTTAESGYYFSSFGTSGFHRTATEIAGKNSISETAAGGNIIFRKNSSKIGATAVYSRYDVPLQKRQVLYNLHDLAGNEFYNAGADFSFLFKSLYFFGEAAYSSSNTVAGVTGVLASLHYNFDLALLYRKYPHNYHSLYSNSFKEGSRVFNEEGLYMGIKTGFRNWRINAYADRFSFPWLKYLVDAPTSGYDFMVDVNYRRSRALEMHWRYRERNKPGNAREKISQLNVPVNQMRRSFRYHLSYKPSQPFTLRSRLELSNFTSENNNPEKGFLFYQDVIYAPVGKKYSLTCRYALFDTETYNTRIYTFENDVLHAYSIPFYYDEGIRYYLLAKYKLNRKTDVWLRFARTIYSNKEFIGSGTSKIDANHKTEVKAQLRFKF